MSTFKIRATSTTIGRPSLGDHKPYVYGGDKPLEDNPDRNLAGCAARTARRNERLAEFAAILAELGHPDPRRFIPGAVVAEAGRRLGVAPKTARSYRTDLRRQREEAQPG